MNYRHHYHAGNFADVMKHVLLLRLLAGLQRKDKGFLFLDTHAGRGAYDLAAAARGDSLARQPEHPQGLGRLWARSDLPSGVTEYVTLVRAFDRERGGSGETPRHYPGSPWIARLRARPQDRLVLCELHPEEHAALAREFEVARRTQVLATDGYAALKGHLPPLERRALVLIDPPFESQDEFARVVSAVGEALRRLPGAVIAVWYPLTERARVDAFAGELRALALPPTLELELAVAGPASPLKMKGCGLMVLNPPWQFEAEARPLLEWLAPVLAQEPGGGARIRWLVEEKASS
ncbi:MAG TPA: 23S rRNA (adenine(2030)-N(6))-methyltransferase RlmJ [Opitutaceae bacterium]|nr:23S rRNA (adenine(2030)-N(6))-methyltransferase RlmJ [Opitutaceae bacterium]HND61822.1 23S rRNA (adenine(2030)-N(6))-methyltransferase RlmJ [Opitutaceae bacterium]